MKNKILIISALFPPLAGGGVQRVKTLAKFFYENGFKVGIYTEALSESKYDVFDFENSPDFPLDIFTRYGLEKNRFKFNPKQKKENRNSYMIYIKGIFNKFLNILFSVSNVGYIIQGIKWSLFSKNKYDVVIGSVRPPSNAVIAFFYARFNNSKLLIEYRDLWFGQEFQKQSKLYNLINGLYERIILREAKYIICVSPAFIKILVERYPAIKQKLVLITNGFSDDYYHSNIESKFRLDDGYLRIAHFGRFYGPRKIDEVLLEIEKMGAKVKFLHYGPEIKNAQIDLSKLRSFEFMGHVDFKTSWKIQQSSLIDILILIEYTSDNIPGKIFEYFASNKPIIIICPKSSVIRDIFQSEDGFYFIENSEIYRLSLLIIEIRNRKNKIYHRNAEKYLRTNLYRKYLEIVNPLLH